MSRQPGSSPAVMETLAACRFLYYFGAKSIPFMKILAPMLVLYMSFLTCSSSFAQPDSAKISAKAITFADSLVKAEAYKNWNIYAELAPASAIKYYGGKDGYIEHSKTIRQRTVSNIDEDYPQLKVLDLMTANDQWQCLIRESRYFHKDDKKFHQVTYFLCQSKDEGESWKLFDVSYNKVANIIYIFPEVFGDLAIPEPSILSEQEEIAQQQAEAAAAAKKTTAKKK